MGAADLLQHVRAAGFTLDLADGKLLVAPASMLTDELRTSLRASKTEVLALLATEHEADAEAIEGLAAITEFDAGTTRADACAVALSCADTATNSTCTAAAAIDTAAVAWTEADIARFVARRDRLMRWGWHEADAEALAERLVKRDRDGDVRVTCVECTHYRPGRCGNHRSAMLSSPDVGRELATLPQRCPGFKP